MSQPARRFHNDRRRMRAWSAVLCALFVVAQLASFAHDALTAHAVCAEHGELVHVARATGAVDAAAVARHRSAPLDIRRSSQRPAIEHEHCGLATLHRERTLTLRVHASAAVAPTCVAAPRLAPPSEQHSSIPLLMLAPKQSPPPA